LIWTKLASAAARLAAVAHIAEGGPMGGLLSGSHVFDRDSNNDCMLEHQVAFTVGVIALGAKMAKADGLVTADEVTAFKEVFKVPEGEMKNVSRIFNLAKQTLSATRPMPSSSHLC